MGKTSTELKLLACQRNDQTWSAVPGDEVIEAEAASDFEQGVLLAVNLNNNRQVQGEPELAASQVIRDLQRFSRLQGKIKEQEEEIEGWKQSLTMQAQALKEREIELDAELEELEQLREGIPADAGGGGGASTEEIEQAKAEADSVREEFERKTQELEQAWAHLRGEQQRLTEQQQALDNQPAAAGGEGNLDPEQTQRLKELVDYLASTHLPTDELTTAAVALRERAEAQGANLNHYQQQLEEQRSDAQQQQDVIETQQQDWDTQNQALQSTRVAIDQAKQQVYEARLALESHNSQISNLQGEIQATGQLIDSLTALAAGEAPPDTEQSAGVDVAELEAMPLEELQSTIDDLQKEFDRNARFVEDQEEELKLQREAVSEIEEKLKHASVYDASALEQELADEQEQRKLLDETLVGQRRTLLEKQAILNQHQKVLRRRQGILDEPVDGTIDLDPVLKTLEAEQTQHQATLEQLQHELPSQQEAVNLAEAAVQEHLSECDRQQGELQALGTTLTESRSAAALLWGRVNLYEEILTQLQENLQDLQQHIETLETTVEQAKQTSDYQLEAINGLNGTVAELAAQT